MMVTEAEYKQHEIDDGTVEEIMKEKANFLVWCRIN